MSAYVIISCDGVTNGSRCRTEETLPYPSSPAEARAFLAGEGWHWVDEKWDVCPTCWETRRDNSERSPR